MKLHLNEDTIATTNNDDLKSKINSLNSSNSADRVYYMLGSVDGFPNTIYYVNAYDKQEADEIITKKYPGIKLSGYNPIDYEDFKEFVYDHPVEAKDIIYKDDIKKSLPKYAYYNDFPDGESPFDSFEELSIEASKYNLNTKDEGRNWEISGLRDNLEKFLLKFYNEDQVRYHMHLMGELIENKNSKSLSDSLLASSEEPVNSDLSTTTKDVKELVNKKYGVAVVDKGSVNESLASLEADTDEQEDAINAIERALRELGITARYGTKIGRYPQTVTLGIRYQDNAIYITPDGEVLINGDKEGKVNPEDIEDVKQMLLEYEFIEDKSVTESLKESDENTVWEEVASKAVEDSNGFLTDYVWYTDGDRHVFVFGDSDIYRPEDGDFDWEIDIIDGKETESYKEAQEWFDSYEGFADLNEATHATVAKPRGDKNIIINKDPYKHLQNWLSKNPIHNLKFDSFEKFREYLAKNVFNKKVEKLSEDENYAIQEIWEDSLLYEDKESLKESLLKIGLFS